MPVKTFRPLTPSTRYITIASYDEITKTTPEKRLVGVCHHFVRLLLTALRAKGVPARARTGFGAYFNPGYFEDHVVVEMWNDVKSRWQRIDPQFDEPWRRMSGIKYSIYDVPADQFLAAADAWIAARSGKIDADKVGIFNANQRGFWFMASSLIREVAELNKMELLQWDVWGGMPPPNHKPTADDFKYFDRLAELTAHPDQSFKELRSIYAKDDRIRVPDTVFNVITMKPESISASP